MFVAIIAFVRHMEHVLESNSVGISLEWWRGQHEHLCGSFQAEKESENCVDKRTIHLYGSIESMRVAS
jgi:hypothetical protein